MAYFTDYPELTRPGVHRKEGSTLWAVIRVLLAIIAISMGFHLSVLVGWGAENTIAFKVFGVFAIIGVTLSIDVIRLRVDHPKRRVFASLAITALWVGTVAEWCLVRNANSSGLYNSVCKRAVFETWFSWDAVWFEIGPPLLLLAASVLLVLDTLISRLRTRDEIPQQER